jgi:restriction system protein
MADSAWMVRAGNNNELVDIFVEESIVAVGWPDLGDLSDRTSRESIRERYTETYEKRKQGRVKTDSTQLHTFTNRIEEGDLLLTYDKDTREYHAGTVDGPYTYGASGSHVDYPHTRAVDWDDDTLSRDDFSKHSQNTLGAALTVFTLDDCLSEIEQLR